MVLHLLTCMALTTFTGYIAAITVFRGLFAPLPGDSEASEHARLAHHARSPSPDQCLMETCS